MTYQPKRNLVAVLVIAGLLLASAATAIIVLIGRDSGTAGQPTTTTTDSQDTRLAAERDAAVEDGTQAARILNTLDHASVEKDLDRWESVATGELLTELTGNRPNVLDQVRTARSKSVGTVRSAALVEFDAEGGTARMLVALSITVDAEGTETVKQSRLSVRLAKTTDGWKAAGVNLV